jgi:excisionase family DNA binding protein
VPDMMNSAPIPASGSFETLSLPPDLAELIGNRRTYKQLAAALNCSERAVYLLVDKHKIPFIRVLNKRYIDPADFRHALIENQSNTSARGRGRPPAAIRTPRPRQTAA